MIGYRNTIPVDTPPAEVAKLSALKFGWDETPKVTSEQYVNGIMTTYDTTVKTI